MKIKSKTFLTEIYQNEEMEEYGYAYLIYYNPENNKYKVYDELNIEMFKNNDIYLEMYEIGEIKEIIGAEKIIIDIINKEIINKEIISIEEKRKYFKRKKKEIEKYLKEEKD
jgi:uncharacterized membrane protein YkgB